jgi:hypothetical protein
MNDRADLPREGHAGVHCEAWPKLQHRQVPLPAERQGFTRPTSQRATTIKDVLKHILGNAVLGSLGAQAEILGRSASVSDLIRIHV